MEQFNDDKVKCYGTLLECKKRHECDLGIPCLSRARESSEDLHYQYQHCSVPQMIYAPNEDADASSDAAAVAYYGTAAQNEVAEALRLNGINIPPESIPYVMSVLEKISEFYFQMPHVLDALLNTIVKGKSQSDIAREKNVTRQCENKRLLRELGIAQKRNGIQERRDRELDAAKKEYTDKMNELRERDEFLKTLSERDWLIYKYRFIDGCTAKSTALQVGCDVRTVFRKSYFIRSNMGYSVIVFKNGRRKNEKKRRKHIVSNRH